MSKQFKKESLAHLAELGYNKIFELAKSKNRQDKQIAVNSVLFGILLSFYIATSLPHSNTLNKTIALGISAILAFVAVNLYIALVKILIQTIVLNEKKLRNANILIIIGILLEAALFFELITIETTIGDIRVSGFWEILDKTSIVLTIFSFILGYIVPSLTTPLNTNETTGQKTTQKGDDNTQNVAGRDIIYNISSDEKLIDSIGAVNSKKVAKIADNSYNHMIALFKNNIKKELEKRPRIRKHFLINQEFDPICVLYDISNSPENRKYFEQAAKELEQEKEIKLYYYKVERSL